MNSIAVQSASLVLGLLASSGLTANEPPPASAAPGYHIEQLLPGSPFCGVHGLGVDSRDRLYAGSVVAQRIYRVDTQDGSVTTEVGPPKGQADDMEFLPDGTLVWTAISQNAVRARKPNGEIVDLATDLVSVNSIAYRESDGRLFVAQVFGGDGLWELDPAGEKPRRNILKDIGGLNGFDIGPDGMIYGPLWFKQQVVRINPDSGDLQVIADGFHTPAAANFDSRWNLYVLDTGTGEVFKVNIETGDKRVFARLQTSLDNLAIDSRDTIYVSNMADNAIHRIDPETAAVAEVVPPGLSCGMALDARTVEGQDTLYLADVFALRAIDGDSGKVTDIGRSHAAGTHIGYPTYVSAGRDYIYSISSEGLQVYDRDHSLVREWNGIRGLQQVKELPNGDLLALGADGTLTRIDKNNYDNQSVVASDLGRVGDMLPVEDNAVFLTLPAKGQLVLLDLARGNQQVINSALDQPMGMALVDDDKLAVMESGGRIVTVSTKPSSDFSIVAENIPAGLFGGTLGIQSPGIAAGKDGTLYALSDRDNTIYRISRKRRQ
jgi:sugar lactone lactonase YvrE